MIAFHCRDRHKPQTGLRPDCAALPACALDRPERCTFGADKLLVALQEGLPLVARPFARIGGDLGLSEEAVLARVRALFDAGVARRLGAVFEARSLGYESTLCAAEVPAGDLEAAAARITCRPAITHCYEREGHPNLWFTLTAPAQELRPELKQVEALLGYEALDLPALQRFKVEAVFGRSEKDRSLRGDAPASRAPLLLTDRERRVVRRLQANIAVVAAPFDALAVELGHDPRELVELLTRWKQAGIIRRIGLIVRHGRLGFSANSMCVWAVAPDRITEAGGIVAQSPHVSHCYQRRSSPQFPFNLYAMIHAGTRQEAVVILEQLAAEAGLPEGRMLWSLREFKKSSPVFFCEPPCPDRAGRDRAYAG